MNYETIKALYNAGFPFERIEPGMCARGEHVDFNPTGDPALGAQHFYIPTLEELIEACGKEFRSLLQYEPVIHPEDTTLIWRAEGYIGDELWTLARGHTATEAVANLWLALNKNI